MTSSASRSCRSELDISEEHGRKTADQAKSHPLALPGPAQQASEFLQQPYPALLVKRDGTVVAANLLACWLWLAPAEWPAAERLLGWRTYDKCIDAVRNGRIPIGPNYRFFDRKASDLRILRFRYGSDEPSLACQIEERLKTSVAKQAQKEGDDYGWPLYSFKDAKDIVEQCYPLRLYPPDSTQGNTSTRSLLNFAVTVIREVDSNEIPVGFQPEDDPTRGLVAESWNSLPQLFPDRAYVQWEGMVDPEAYNEIHALGSEHKSTIPINSLQREIWDTSTIAPPEPVTVFDLEAGRPFEPRHFDHINQVLGRPAIDEFEHAFYGRGRAWGLAPAGTPRHVERLDLFLPRGVATVRRADDLGVLQTSAILFERLQGKAHHGDGVLTLLSKHGRSVVRVYSDGRYQEDSNAIGSVEEDLPAAADVSRFHTGSTHSIGAQHVELREALTVTQAAELLDVRPSTVIHAIRRDRLPATKVNRRWEIDRADLAMYQRSLAYRRTKPGPRPRRP